MKVPEMKKCCFCVPLRHGIIIFALINLIFSLFAGASLAITTESYRRTVSSDSSFELLTCTILFGIFGMSILLNILLLIAGCQKDIPMLRLYLFYGLGTTLAALVLTSILITRMMYYDVCAAGLAIVMQGYVIILVRSEIVKLEKQLIGTREQNQEEVEAALDVSDRMSLL